MRTMRWCVCLIGCAVLASPRVYGDEPAQRPKRLLSPRLSAELFSGYPRSDASHYSRLPYANPLAKPAYYALMHRSKRAGTLIGIVGDESDVELLKERLRFYSKGYQYQGQSLDAVTTALRILGDRGYTKAYTVLDDALTRQFLWEVKPRHHNTFMWDIISELGRSNYGKYEVVLDRLSKMLLAEEIHEKLKKERAELLRSQKSVTPRKPMRVMPDWLVKKTRSQFRQKDDRLLQRMLSHLPTYGVNTVVLLPEILALMENRSDDIVQHCLIIIGAMGPAAKKAVPKLRPYLDHWNVRVRMNAILALANLGDAKAINAYFDGIELKFPQEQLYTFAALGMLDHELSPKMAKTLERFLSTDDTKAIKERNGKLFPRGTGHGRAESWYYHVPEVIKAAPTNGAPLRCAAAYALSRSKHRMPVDVVKKAFALGNRQLTLTLLESTSLSWKGRKELIPIVLPYVKHKDETLSILAVEAIGNIGVRDPAAAKTIAAQLTKIWWECWKDVQIVRTLARIGNEDTLAKLKKTFRHKVRIPTSVLLKREADLAINAIEEHLARVQNEVKK